MKLIKNLFFLTLLCFIAYFIFNVIDSPIQVTPYPFSIKADPNLSKVKVKADILILGDKLCLPIESRINAMSNNLSKNLRSKLIIQTSCFENFGIHRLISHLKKYTLLPPVIILFTGSEEFAEKTFNVSQYKKIKKNFLLSQNEKIKSLTLVFKFLSKFIYKRIKKVVLTNELTPLSMNENDLINQRILELKFLLFKNQLNELIELAQVNNSKIIFVSPAINYEEIKIRSCQNSTTIELEEQLNNYLKNLKNLKLKKIYNKLIVMKDHYQGNSKLFYVISKIAKQLGHLSDSKKYLKLSLSYSCNFENINPIFKSIIRELSTKYEYAYIDSNKYLPAKNAFIYQGVPQDLYYNKLEIELESQLKKILNLE